MSKLFRGLTLKDEIARPVDRLNATTRRRWKHEWWAMPYTILAIAGSLGGLFLMWWNGR
jgi:hypothetical protein